MWSENQSFDIEGTGGNIHQAEVGILTPEEMEQIMASLSPLSPLGRLKSKAHNENDEQEA